MEKFVDRANTNMETLRLHDVLGKRVLAKSGSVLGRVKAIHVNKDKYRVEGIEVRKLFAEDKYVSIGYIQSISTKAVILSVEPSTLFEGHAVVSQDGKKIGTVKRVQRVGETNKVASITVRHWWSKTTHVPAEDIAHFGTSIILTKTIEQLKRDRKSRR